MDNQFEEEFHLLKEQHTQFKKKVMIIWFVASCLFWPLFLLGYVVWLFADAKYGNKIIDLAITNLVPACYKKSFDVEQFQINSGVDENTIKNAELLNTDGVLKSNSLLTADYKGHKLLLSNFHFENGDHEPSLFSGQWLTIQNLNLKGFELRILSKNAVKWFSNNIYCQTPATLVEYETGDEEFDSKFKIYTNDFELMENVLSSEMIKLLSSIENETGKYITISYANETINIAYSKQLYFFQGDRIKKAKNVEDMYNVCFEAIDSCIKPIKEVLDLAYKSMD